jgi:hypothetical protein
MFNTARQPGGSQAYFYEAYVAGVDMQRHECKIRTDYGQTINGVRWLKNAGGSSSYGDNTTPAEKDRVMVMRMPNNQHWILGYIPVQTNVDIRAVGPAIGKQGMYPEELANFSVSQSDSVSGDQSHPADQRVGDWTRTSHGGGMIALLRAGTVMMKASPTSMLMLSPFDDLGRLVTRNWEHFTDVDSTRKISSGGAVSMTHEVYPTSARARSELPSMREVRGGADAVGDAGGIARRTTFDDAGVQTSQQTEYANGRKHQIIETGGSKVETDTTITGHSTKVHGGDTTFFNMDENTIHFDVGGDVKVDANKDGITIDVAGQGKLVIPRSGDITMECTANMKLKSGGNMDFESAGSMNFGAGGGLNFTSASGGGDATMTVGKLNVKANEVNFD